MKKIPYGISNFKELIEGNYLYVDKTKYIETLEFLPPYIFLIRPRRFGKSLFIQMLKYYYDINYKNEFETLFGDLYIGKNPTPKRNSFLVLHLDFSKVETSKGMDELYKSFNENIVRYVNIFINQYKNILNTPLLDVEKTTGINAVSQICDVVKNINKRIYVIIDEYDNFANDLIGSNNEVMYKKVMQENGFVRTFYKTLKAETTSVIDKMFVTGVAPLMLDDLTSGANMMSNHTIDKITNEIMGFTEEEVIKVVKELEIDKKYSLERLLYDMKVNYNGYLFNKRAKNKLFNSDMVLYFLNRILVEDEYPDKLIDDNIKTDYGKLRKLAQVFDKNSKFNEILREGTTVLSELVTKIGIGNMFSEAHFVSLLFYMGFLTIDDDIEDYIKNSEAVVLKQPNYVIKKMYWEAFMEEIWENDKVNIKTLDILKAVNNMAVNGEIKDFLEILKGTLNQISNRNLQNFDEKYIKLLFLFHLGLSKTYIVSDEKEVEGGYIDIFIEKGAYEGNVNYQWVVELKYVKVEDSQKESFMKNIREQGANQLNKYLQSEYIKNKIGKTNLKSGVLIFKGKNDYEWIEIKNHSKELGKLYKL